MDNGKEREAGFNYALSGKIMLIAIVVLFVVVIIMVCLHVHIRWHLLRTRRRSTRQRRRPPPQFVFYVDPMARMALTTVTSRGLDASVISSLPVFAFSPMTHPEPVECSVCLSEFENGETGRILPKCNHSFHIDCIDMWFQSHSTCPLCRAPVEPLPAGETRPEVTVTVRGPEPGSSSGLHNGEEVNRSGPVVSSLSSSTGKSSFMGVTVEVPGRNDSFGGESGSDSQSSFRSPMSRVLSFTRILSRERKASASPSSSCVVGCSSSMTEIDAERGGKEETQ